MYIFFLHILRLYIISMYFQCKQKQTHWVIRRQLNWDFNGIYIWYIYRERIIEYTVSIRCGNNEAETKVWTPWCRTIICVDTGTWINGVKTMVWKLWLGNYGVETVLWKQWCRYNGVETIVWKQWCGKMIWKQLCGKNDVETMMYV